MWSKQLVFNSPSFRNLLCKVTFCVEYSRNNVHIPQRYPNEILQFYLNFRFEITPEYICKER